MKNKDQYSSRERKKEKKNKDFEKKGKYSSKHIRIQIENNKKYNLNNKK